MATPAQILANRQNAERSSGPVTVAGKTRVSQNATKLGLFSVANFVRPEEQNIFNEFESGYIAELSPATPLQQTLAREIVHAAWRLRRCASLEVAPPENLTEEELDRLQASIDRARAAASAPSTARSRNCAASRPNISTRPRSQSGRPWQWTLS
jgi:hypothetical protein